MSTFRENIDRPDASLVTGDQISFQKHLKSPYHFGRLKCFDGKALGVGSCGDRLEITLQEENGTIIDVGYLPHGCDFTVACGSAVSLLAIGKTLEDALLISPEDVEQELGGLPADHRHCARLAVNTLGEAIAEAYRKVVRS